MQGPSIPHMTLQQLELALLQQAELQEAASKLRDKASYPDCAGTGGLWDFLTKASNADSQQLYTQSYGTSSVLNGNDIYELLEPYMPVGDATIRAGLACNGLDDRPEQSSVHSREGHQGSQDSQSMKSLLSTSERRLAAAQSIGAASQKEAHTDAIRSWASLPCFSTDLKQDLALATVLNAVLQGDAVVPALKQGGRPRVGRGQVLPWNVRPQGSTGELAAGLSPVDASPSPFTASGTSSAAMLLPPKSSMAAVAQKDRLHSVKSNPEQVWAQVLETAGHGESSSPGHLKRERALWEGRHQADNFVPVLKREGSQSPLSAAAAAAAEAALEYHHDELRRRGSYEKSFDDAASDQDDDFSPSQYPMAGESSRGAASLRPQKSTRPRSVAERMRRERISVRLQQLKEVMPKTDVRADTAGMLEDAVVYIKSLHARCRSLERHNGALTSRITELNQKMRLERQFSA